MSFSKPLKFKVANWRAPKALLAVLFLLILLSMAAEPWPLMYILPIVLLGGAGFLFYILGIHKVDNIKLISVIFPDGRVKLESAGKIRIEGILSGGQWNTSHLTVLRYKTGGKRQQIVLLLSLIHI